VRALGEERVAEFMRRAFARHVGPGSGVTLSDEYRLLVARA
jgi:hypothetical protein